MLDRRSIGLAALVAALLVPFADLRAQDMPSIRTFPASGNVLPMRGFNGPDQAPGLAQQAPSSGIPKNL